MPNSENSVRIASRKVIIDDPHKPMKLIFYLAVLILGLQGIFFVVRFQISGAVYQLIIGVFLAFMAGLIVSREVFFRTYKKEIPLDEIRQVNIQKLLFGQGRVYLNIRLKNKVRTVLLEQKRAEEIKREIDFLR